MAPTVAVYLEVGPKRSFAGAIEWPGWCRAGRHEEGALAALAAYAPRYQAAIGRAARAGKARRPFVPPSDVASLEVVERLQGGTGTDFGVPSVAPAADDRPVDEVELVRLRGLLAACWTTFDAAAVAAVGAELTKGPRGGGRDLDKIVTHVREADEAYLHQLGSKMPWAKVPGPRGPDTASELRRLRDAALAALSARARGEGVAEPNKVLRPWSPRYFVRRAAWHLLDHAWEIEDRARFVQDGTHDKGVDAGAQAHGER